MKSLKLSFVGYSSLVLAACVGTDSQMKHDTDLEGTSWRLEEIRYPSTSIRIGDAEAYTMLLQHDGRASLQLDCNRGFGQWTASSHHDGTGGEFAISDMGVTKAMCPPASNSDMVTADIQRFAKFNIEGENLVTSLADGSASYVWIPASATDEAEPE